jgi:hypothetical protein
MRSALTAAVDASKPGSVFSVAWSLAAPVCSLTAMSDEPARRFRGLPFLLEYRPVFAW